MKFLGHVLFASGVSIDPEKVEAVMFRFFFLAALEEVKALLNY